MEGKEVPKAVQAVERGGVRKNWRRLIFGEKIHTSHLMQGSEALASNPQNCLLSIGFKILTKFHKHFSTAVKCSSLLGVKFRLPPTELAGVKIENQRNIHDTSSKLAFRLLFS